MELTPKGQKLVDSLKEELAMPLTIAGLLIVVAIPIGALYVVIHFVVKYW